MSLHKTGANQYAYNNSFSPPSIPFTFRCWVKLDSDNSDQIPWGMEASGTASLTRLDFDSGGTTGRFEFRNGDSGGENTANAGADSSEGTWHLVHCIRAAADDNTIYVDNGNSGNNITSRTFSGIDQVCFGRTNSGSSFEEMLGGNLAEAAIFDSVFDTNDINEDWNGGAGLPASSHSKASGLVHYWPLLNDGEDDVGSNNLTLFGASYDSEDHPVSYAPPVTLNLAFFLKQRRRRWLSHQVPGHPYSRLLVPDSRVVR